MLRSQSGGIPKMKNDFRLEQRRRQYQSIPRERRCWMAMIGRCGKKGSRYETIKVCSRWKKFENFYKDMGPAPGSNFTIERKKSNKNYTPSNCTWATYKDQARNTKQNRYLTVDSQTKTLAEWSEETNLSVHVIRKRIFLGWSIRRAVETPKYATRRKDHPHYNGRWS